MNNQLTDTDKTFIVENRLQMSMNDMANHLGNTFSRVRKYINDNNLGVSKQQSQSIRVEKMHHNKQEAKKKGANKNWVRDPWNHNLNLVTMTRTATNHQNS